MCFSLTAIIIASAPRLPRRIPGSTIFFTNKGLHTERTREHKHEHEQARTSANKREQPRTKKSCSWLFTLVHTCLHLLWLLGLIGELKIILNRTIYFNSNFLKIRNQLCGNWFVRVSRGWGTSDTGKFHVKCDLDIEGETCIVMRKYFLRLQQLVDFVWYWVITFWISSQQINVTEVQGDGGHGRIYCGIGNMQISILLGCKR